ncbi:unnamed protein product [Angiostrongylus costaricensis]|uniref:Transposase n=1 Tax=Angiostrongylus costaricensis TaxID=334426 RepID=A0A0R3PYQ1_ANGCS|nr:unnamed protein product [Angiostrongylus costaricensis]
MGRPASRSPGPNWVRASIALGSADVRTTAMERCSISARVRNSVRQLCCYGSRGCKLYANVSVCSLEERLPDLIEEWKDDQDPRIPDRNRYVPEEERDEVERITREAKLARRQRDAAKRAEEEALGMWDE